MMSTYKAYGLTIASILPLPELQASVPEAADVTIRLGHVERPARHENCGGTCFRLTPRDARLCWDAVGAYQVRGGSEIVVDPCAGVEEALLRLPLLGAVMAVLLHQRGHLVLHASAVEVDSGAVLFLGAKGQGKSTLAAALVSRGHSLVADDVVALQVDPGDAPIAVAGMPHIKLWPDAVAGAIGQDPEALPRLYAQSEKRFYRSSPPASWSWLPVRRLYVLAEGSPAATEPLPPLEALQQLLGHSYIARFGPELLRGDEASSHFQRCVRLAGSVPACRLRRTLSLAALPDLAARIEEEVAQTLCQASALEVIQK